jgi:hypothetical protein
MPVRRGLAVVVAACAIVVAAAPASALAADWITPIDGARALTGPTFTLRTRMPWSEVPGGNVFIYRDTSRFDASVLWNHALVMYDPEPWSVTPMWQQRHPVTSMQRFVEDARAAGDRPILAPARALVNVERAVCRRARSETVTDAFFRCGLASIPTDYYLLQAQKLECDLDRFSEFVEGARAAVAGSLLVELTATPFNECATPEAIAAAWQASTPYADGWGMWVCRKMDDWDGQVARAQAALDLIAAT